MGPPSEDLVKRLVTLAEREPSAKRMIELAEHMVKLRHKAQGRVGPSKLDAPSELNARVVHAISCLVPRREDWARALDGSSSWAAEAVSIIEEIITSLGISRWNWERDVDTYQHAVDADVGTTVGGASALLAVFTRGGTSSGWPEPPAATRLVELLVGAAANPTAHQGQILVEAAATGWSRSLALLLESPMCAAAIGGKVPTAAVQAALYNAVLAAARRLDVNVLDVLLKNGAPTRRPPSLPPRAASDGLLPTAGALTAITAAEGEWLLECQLWPGETVADKLQAIGAARVRCLALLIEHGADPTEVDGGGKVALAYSLAVRRQGLPNYSFGTWTSESRGSSESNEEESGAVDTQSSGKQMLPEDCIDEEISLLEKHAHQYAAEHPDLPAVPQEATVPPEPGAGIVVVSPTSGTSRRQTGENTLPVFGTLGGKKIPVFKTNVAKGKRSSSSTTNGSGDKGDNDPTSTLKPKSPTMLPDSARNALAQRIIRGSVMLEPDDNGGVTISTGGGDPTVSQDEKEGDGSEAGTASSPSEPTGEDEVREDGQPDQTNAVVASADTDKAVEDDTGSPTTAVDEKETALASNQLNAEVSSTSTSIAGVASPTEFVNTDDRSDWSVDDVLDEDPNDDDAGPGNDGTGHMSPSGSTEVSSSSKKKKKRWFSRSSASPSKSASPTKDAAVTTATGGNEAADAQALATTTESTPSDNAATPTTSASPPTAVPDAEVTTTLEFFNPKFAKRKLSGALSPSETVQ